jgi:acetyl-CoA synthetase
MSAAPASNEGAATTWGRARAALDGLPGGRGLNIGHETVDRHADGSGRPAFSWRHRDGTVNHTDYDELRASTNRFARTLEALDIDRGDAVATLAGRVPELYEAALGALKRGAVYLPLFAAFGPEPVAQRLERGRARVLVTTQELYDRKVAPIRDRLGHLDHVLVIDGDAGGSGLDYHQLVDAQEDRYEIPDTDPSDPALLHFTSGTTGMPKGALHVHEAVVAHHATGASVLDLRPDDTYWCTADPGWVTGTSYGIIAPLSHGVRCVVDEGDFDASRWYGLLEEEEVNVWYTAPTAIRMLERAGAEAVQGRDLSRLRLVASVGEPLDAEAVRWSDRTWGVAVHDTWWQTETGGIMLANLPGVEVRPGSMGRPLPGVEAALLERGPDGQVVVHDGRVTEVEGAGEGELALRPGWPSMFRGYLGEPERYQACFEGGWYLSGDIVRRDEEGYHWFVGRADDVIKSAGHLVGPFEVERVLMEHPAVSEAGVIGLPDAVAGELVCAHVVLHRGHEPTEELRRELRAFARQRLGPAVAPRTIEFDEALPHTRSGKIMRRLLRARALGLEEGDLSMLESS